MKVRVSRKFDWVFPGAPITVTFNVGQIWNVTVITDTSIEIRRQNVEMTVSRFEVKEYLEEIADAQKRPQNRF